MSTYTIRPRERHHGASEWTLHHPMIATAAALTTAVVAGALIGILFSVIFAGAPTATQHRAGGHAKATVAAARGSAAVATETVGARTVIASTTSRTRSPARGGFAVGRTEGAGSGVIVIGAGTRAPARGGFVGRSLGAGQAASSVAQGLAVD
jgi:hypothetical protein